jgi:2-polyprenyl-6-methoxyphenol hydroxylase-like FAD-dependent oxidoreductase
MASDLPIIVVGGGIGGAATALALSRKGRRTLVLEQASELGEIGAGIQMPPNAFKAFRSLGVLEAVQEIAAYPERLVLGDMLTGEPIYQSPIREDFTRRFGFPYALMHRGDLLQILVDACRASDFITIRTNARVVSFREVGDRVLASTEAGDTFEGSAMIAADGLWSATRRALLGAEMPRTDGYVVCRGVVPIERIPEALYSKSVTMWGGPELDLFHYPLRRGEIYNIGASYRDPALRPGEPNPVVSHDALSARFREASQHVRSLLEHIDTSRSWVLYDRPPIKEWSRGRVALLGDAAHPTTIYISQGACLALEDAVVIAEMVARTPDIAKAFRAYAEARYLRCARIQLTSRQFGEVYHATGVLRELRDHLLADARPEALCDTLEWVFGRAEADGYDVALATG